MYEKIMVAIDGSETSRQALDAALALARAFDATVQPLFAISVPVYTGAPMYDPTPLRDALVEEGALVTAEAGELMKAAGLKGAPRVVETHGFQDVAQGVIAAADEFGADLLVLGTHGRSGFRRLVLGSVAESVLRRATRPVLLVPSKEAHVAQGEADAAR